MGAAAAVGEEAVVFVLDAGAWVRPYVTSHALLPPRYEEKDFENARLTLIQPDGARISSRRRHAAVDGGSERQSRRRA